MIEIPDEWSRNTVRTQPHTESARAFNALRQQVIAAIARAEAAEAKLARVLEILKPDGPPIPGGMFDKENRFYYRYGKALHAHAVALAEGRDHD